MAEERLIDEDKDKKYKIRKNADGEDELYIDETPDEVAEEIVDFFFDDEEEEIMTPEQIAERDRLLQAEKERIELKLSVFLERAEELLKEGDYAGAETSLTQAEDLSPTSGKTYVLRCRVLTKEFTDFSRLDEAKAAAIKVELFASKEEKEDVIPKLVLVKKNLEKATKLKIEREERNEAQKAERRVILKAERRRATIHFSIVSAVVILCIALMGYFLSIRNASLSGTFMYLAIGFAVASGVAFVADLFFIKRLWAAARKCKLNERNSASKLGREYEEAKGEFDAYTAIYTAFTVDKESK